MSNRPLVSVCLPVFNGDKYLSAAIEAALAQSYENIELLIADDGSNDSSRSIAESFAAKDKRVRFWINEKRFGLFENYNECLRQAKGEYIKTYAQDDLLAPEAIAKMLAVLQNNRSIALVTTAQKVIDQNGEELKRTSVFPRSMKIPAREVITFNLISLNNWVGEPSTAMFRREHAGSGFDTGFYHYGDIEFWFRILAHGDYYFLDDFLCSFRRHPDSQTDKNHKELYYALDILRLSLKYRHILKDIEPEALFRRRISEAVALQMGHVSASIGHDLSNDFETIYLNESKNTPAPAAGFRLLSSYALSALTEAVADLDHEKRCRFDEHELFVAEVQKMQNSLYWKMTEPLRAVKNVLTGRKDG
ncbi:MAG: glycosyltransferase [Candidatus Obscuribacterales bacterium]|nr:glycosyltransferase [Candidatus Obscuribacterales bacterium]